MKVTLTGGELYVGATVGIARRLAAMRRNRPQTYGQPTAPLWQLDIEAALAEMAVAKALGRYWASPLLEQVGQSVDLDGVNVRSTPHQNGGLLLHRADQDEIPYVLVRGCSPVFDVAGWAYGRDGKLPGYWRTDIRTPCYMVPADKLRPMDHLLFILGGHADDGSTGSPVFGVQASTRDAPSQRQEAPGVQQQVARKMGEDPPPLSTPRGN